MEALGIAAIALGGAGYIWKDPKVVMKLFFISSLLWVAYFISLKQSGAALSSMISADLHHGRLCQHPRYAPGGARRDRYDHGAHTFDDRGATGRPDGHWQFG